MYLAAFLRIFGEAATLRLFPEAAPAAVDVTAELQARMGHYSSSTRGSAPGARHAARHKGQVAELLPDPEKRTALLSCFSAKYPPKQAAPKDAAPAPRQPQAPIGPPAGRGRGRGGGAPANWAGKVLSLIHI